MSSARKIIPFFLFSNVMSIKKLTTRFPDEEIFSVAFRLIAFLQIQNCREIFNFHSQRTRFEENERQKMDTVKNSPTYFVSTLVGQGSHVHETNVCIFFGRSKIPCARNDRLCYLLGFFTLNAHPKNDTSLGRVNSTIEMTISGM